MAKIFHLITSIHLGGAEVIAFNLAEHCSVGEKGKANSFVVELHKSNSKYAIDKKKELRHKNINTLSLGNKSKRASLLIAPFRLAYYLVKYKPDIVQSHTDLPDFVLAASLRILSMANIKPPKIVRTIQNTVLWPTHDLMGKFTEKPLRNDQVVGVSEMSLQAYINLRQKYNLPVTPHQHVIYNTVRVPGKIENDFRIDRSKINIVFCGRFEYQKGVDILVERVRAVTAKFPGRFVFHIVGSGSLKAEVEALAGSNDAVVLYDAVANFADRVHAFDFMIMTSRFEGLTLTSLEASLAGLPVIAARAPGLDETFPENWPLRFDLDNEEELLAVFSRINNGEYNLEQLKEAVFAFVSEKFSHAKMIRDYSNLYARIYEQEA